MKDGFIRVAAASPALRVADPKYNAEVLTETARLASEQGVRVLVTPRLSLTGSELGDLMHQPLLLRSAEQALAEYIRATADLDLLSLVGLPILCGAHTVAAVAAVLRGELLALASADGELDGAVCVSVAGFSDRVLSSRLLLACREMPELILGVGADEGGPAPASVSLSHMGATLIACPAAEPELVGSRQARLSRVLALSRQTRTAYLYAGAGQGESGTDFVFSGHRIIAEGGKLTAEARPFADGTLTVAAIDLAGCLLSRGESRDFEADPFVVPFSLPCCETAFVTPPVKNPFLPGNPEELAERARSIFEIQSRGLALRMERAYAKSLVLGVSGGLDSTLALLVAVRAAEIRGLSADAVHAVTMPCFGTTSRTRGNAEKLSEALGARLSAIDIRASVMQHFADIGHDPDLTDVVYENAQARERTQILMDVANAEGGLVVGTGDLSELALGWATYNGDHMSMYGVNAAVPKTLLRHIVSTLADGYDEKGEGRVAEILRDVLATPVSPELLPPRDGEIAQCTEGIVGPYELHDFFLYHLVKHRFAPHKILRLAVAAFDGEYGEEVIRSWLTVFLKRFFSQQFKRSCLPDGPAVGTLSFSPRTSWHMPSDASSAAWLLDLAQAPVYRKDGTTLG